MDSNSFFYGKDETGITILYKLLLKRTINGKQIIWYTDGQEENDGKKRIYISSYKENNGIIILEEINSAKEIDEYINIFKLLSKKN